MQQTASSFLFYSFNWRVLRGKSSHVGATAGLQETLTFLEAHVELRGQGLLVTSLAKYYLIPNTITPDTHMHAFALSLSLTHTQQQLLAERTEVMYIDFSFVSCWLWLQKEGNSSGSSTYRKQPRFCVKWWQIHEGPSSSAASCEA